MKKEEDLELNVTDKLNYLYQYKKNVMEYLYRKSHRRILYDISEDIFHDIILYIVEKKINKRPEQWEPYLKIKAWYTYLREFDPNEKGKSKYKDKNIQESIALSDIMKSSNNFKKNHNILTDNILNHSHITTIDKIDIKIIRNNLKPKDKITLDCMYNRCSVDQISKTLNLQRSATDYHIRKVKDESKKILNYEYNTRRS